MISEALRKWLLVETLSPGGPHTVVADGGMVKSWASLARIRSNYGRAATSVLPKLVRECVDTAAECEEVFADAAGNRLRALGVPILGLFGDTHAVHVWIGPVGDEPPPRRRAAAVEWDAISQRAHHGADHDELILGSSAPRGLTRAPNDFFRRVVRFEGKVDYFTLAANIEAGGKFEGALTVRDDRAGLRVLMMHARAYTENGARSVRILVHDITDVVAPDMAYDSTALRVAADAYGEGIALMTLDGALVYEWLSPPPASIAQWEDESPVIHPDAYTLLQTECERLRRAGGEARLVLQVRFGTGDWITTEAVITRIMEDPAPMGLAVFTVAEPAR